MKPSSFKSFIVKATKSNLPTMTLGSPGIGKSAIYEEAAREAGYNFKVIYPSLLDPTDISGLPMPAEGQLIRMLDDEIGSIFDTQEPTMVLIDEIGQASPAMQAACAPLLLSRKVGKNVLGDNVSVHAATNKRSDRAGASSILTHLISRCAWVGELETDVDEWLEWAMRAGIRPEIVSFLRFRPTLLHAFDANSASQETKPYACPRSWDNASKLMNAIGNDKDIEREAISGCIGEGTASEFMTHLATARAAFDIEKLLEDPSTLKIPKEMSARYALTSGLAVRCGKKTIESVVDIAKRLEAEENGEFAVMLLRESMIRYRDFVMSPTFKGLLGTPLHKAIMEA